MSRRILVLGPPASGKTTLAKQLSELLGLPHIEADRLYWKSDKGMEINPQFETELKVQLAQPGWILEGLFKRTHPYLDGLVSEVLQLDTPYLTIVRRSFLRGMQTGRWDDLRINTNPNSFKQRRRLFNAFRENNNLKWRKVQGFNDV